MTSRHPQGYVRISGTLPTLGARRHSGAADLASSRTTAASCGRRAEQLGMYIEVIGGACPSRTTPAPSSSTVARPSQPERCAYAARQLLPGRRYENFTSLADWQYVRSQSPRERPSGVGRCASSRCTNWPWLSKTTRTGPPMSLPHSEREGPPIPGRVSRHRQQHLSAG